MEGLGFLLALAILYIFPLIHVVVSDRSRGGATLGWFIAVCFFGFIGWAVFLIVTQNNRAGEAQ